MDKMCFSSEVKFCVRYLVDHGIDSTNFSQVKDKLKSDDEEFEFVKVNKTENFFEELAAKLRELWPPGEKDGKYPWRDSVSNLSKRLTLLWSQRFPAANKDSIMIERCLSVARKYLAQYEENTKYMMTLKYFIMKQESIIDPKDGRIIYASKSRFADMLESQTDFDKIDEELNDTLGASLFEEGELI